MDKTEITPADELAQASEEEFKRKFFDALWADSFEVWDLSKRDANNITNLAFAHVKPLLDRIRALEAYLAEAVGQWRAAGAVYKEMNERAGKATIVKTLTNQHGQPFCVYLSDGKKIGIQRDGGAAWLRIEDTPIVHAATPDDDSAPFTNVWVDAVRLQKRVGELEAKLAFYVNCENEAMHDDEPAQTDGQPESYMSIALRADSGDRPDRESITLPLRLWKQVQAQLASLTHAAHMPDDYPYGLPSWINQRLYRTYIEQGKDQGHWDALTAALDARDKAEAQLADANALIAEYAKQEDEGRCPVGHNKKFTWEMNGEVGCVACERDELSAQLAEAQAQAGGFQNAYEDALTGNRAILQREVALRTALEVLAVIAQTLEEYSSDGCLFCGRKKHASTCSLNGALETYRQLALNPQKSEGE